MQVFMFKGKVDTSSSGGGDETSYRPSTMTPAACKQTVNQGAQARTEKSSTREATMTKNQLPALVNNSQTLCKKKNVKFQKLF